MNAPSDFAAICNGTLPLAFCPLRCHVKLNVVWSIDVYNKKTHIEVAYLPSVQAIHGSLGPMIVSTRFTEPKMYFDWPVRTKAYGLKQPT